MCFRMQKAASFINCYFNSLVSTPDASALAFNSVFPQLSFFIYSNLSQLNMCAQLVVIKVSLISVCVCVCA